MLTRAHHVLFALALLVPVGSARADTLKVPSEAFPTIQSALSAATGDDIVSVAKGVYKEQLVIFNVGVTVKGKGAVVDAEFGGPCLTIAGSDMSISGLTLVNGTKGIADMEDEGFGPPDRLTVSKCVIRSCETAILLRGESITIDRTLVQDCLTGIVVEGSDSFDPIVVTRNRVERTQTSAITISGPVVSVSRNVVIGSLLRGIDVQLSDPDEGEGEGADSVITKNQVLHAGDSGIRVTNSSGPGGVSITKNKLLGNGRGLQAEGDSFVIRGNDCSRNVTDGMLLGGFTSDHFALSVVEANRCRGNGRNGIKIDGPFICRFIPPTPNEFRLNTSQGNGLDGILITHAHDDEFIGNISSKNGGDGLDIDVRGPTLRDIRLVGNSFLKNEHEGIDNGGEDTLMLNNRCKGNARGLGPDLAGTGDDDAGNAIDLGGNKFKTGGFDVPARLDLEIGI